MLYTANFLNMVLIHLNWWSNSFRLHQIFLILNLMIQMLFFQNQQAPGSNYRKLGKSLKLIDLSDDSGPERVRTKKKFFYFSTKTYVVGTQKNRLNETVL